MKHACTPLPRRIPALPLLLALLPAACGAEGGWWTEDVWTDPGRPFLYYGTDARPAERRREPEKADGKDGKRPGADRDLSSLATLAEVRAEYDARLERAVMDPAPENVRSFLAVNAFVLEKSHRFALAFDRGRIAAPAYDWTSTNPSANFATAELSTLREARTDALLRALAPEAGLLFAGGPDETVNGLAAGPVRAFARSCGFDLLAVHTTAPVPGLGTRPDNGVVRAALSGSAGEPPPERLPALLLVPSPSARHPALAALGGRPVLLATGVTSVSELRRRTVLLLSDADRERDGTASLAAAAIDRVPGASGTAAPSSPSTNGMKHP